MNFGEIVYMFIFYQIRPAGPPISIPPVTAQKVIKKYTKIN